MSAAPELVLEPGSLFARIFGASPVAMIVLRAADGRFVEVNRAFLALLGLNHGDVIGRTPFDLGLVEESRFGIVVADITKAGAVEGLRIRWVDRAGHQRHLVASAKLETIDGEPYVIGMLQDMGAFERVQAALDRSHSRFRQLFDNMPLAVIVFDAATLRILDVNPASSRQYGYTREEMIGLSLDALRDPASRAAMLAEILPALNAGQAVNLGVRPHVRRDGSPLEVDVVSFPFELDGRPVYLAVLRDVTEELAEERLLRHREQGLRIIADVVQDGLWDFDLSTGDVRRNERPLYLVPDKLEPSVAAWLERIHSDDLPVVQAQFAALLASGGSDWLCEYRVYREDGTIATVLDRGIVLRDEEGRPVRAIGATIDISAPVEIAEMAGRAAQEERQRLAGELHDTVTQALYGATLLAEAARRASQDGQRDQVASYVGRLGELTRHALRHMRLLVYELRPAVVADLGLVGALRHRLEAVEKRAGISAELRVNGLGPLPLVVEEQVFRMAEEALNNALRHGAATSVAVDLSLEDGHVVLEVVDNGHGFDAQQGPRGGAGLAQIEERAERLSGTLGVTTQPGQGTTLRVALPVDLPAQSPDSHAPAGPDT